MGDAGKGENRFKRLRTLLPSVVLAVAGAVMFIALAGALYLATPLPAQQASRVLTSYLRQNFTIDRVQVAGGTLHLRGVRLANPPGFPGGWLAAADSIAIAPDWTGLLLGRIRFRLIELAGIRIVLDQNGKGGWNFEQLRQLLAARKDSGTETRIDQFIVKAGAVRINGQEVQGISLRLFNLASKGSHDAKIDLAFEDAAGHRFALKGKVRAGTDPDLDLSLTAPLLPLKALASLLRLQGPDLPDGGLGSLRVETRLHKGELSGAGGYEFSQTGLSGAKQPFPLAGRLEIAAGYNFRKDAGRLLNCTLTVDNLARLHAVGSADGLKRERNFILDLGLDEVDLALVNTFVPEETRRNLVVGGKLGCRRLHITGNGAQGVTGASGDLRLYGGSLTRKGQLLVSGLSGTTGFSQVKGEILAKGRLFLAGPREKALLETLEMPFALTVSRQFKLLGAEIASFSARVTGIAVSGRLGFDPSKESPLTASLKAPSVQLAALNPLLKRYGLDAGGGNASVVLNIAGKSLQELGATASLQLADVHGRREKNFYAVKNGSLTASLQRGAGHLMVRGDARMLGMAFNGKAGAASFRYFTPISTASVMSITALDAPV